MTRLSVLYVDDDPDIRLIVEMSLKLDPQIDVYVAGSAPAAVAMLGAGPLPDTVLVDVMMPGTDGLALLDQLRACAATAALPVVFLTARARARDISSYHERGAAGVIVKPFDPLTLAAQLRDILRAPGQA